MDIIHHTPKDAMFPGVSFPKQITPTQPIAQALISIDSTSTSFADDTPIEEYIISQDYTQDTTFAFPPRTQNPSISAVPPTMKQENGSSPIFHSPNEENIFSL
ncbi:hypothetical protein QTN25_003596 [Entamoeba marina]